MSEWQPIETAPTKKNILVFYTNALGKNRIVKAKNVGQFEELADEAYDDWGEYSEELGDYFCPPGWYEIIDNWDDLAMVQMSYDPTHWMPLPEPPTEERD